MTDTIIGAFIGVCGAIVGAVIAGTASYFIAIHILRKQKFYCSCAKFREAFIFEMDFLKYGENPISSIKGTAYDVLTKAYKCHRIAYENFMLTLPASEHIRFRQAWKDYLYPNGYNKKADFPLLDYADGDDFEKRKLAHSKIIKLIEFAEIK